MLTEDKIEAMARANWPGIEWDDESLAESAHLREAFRAGVCAVIAANEEKAAPAVPKALTKWANSPELVETGNQWQQGYEHARAWVHVQLSCSSSHTSQPAVPQGEPVAFAWRAKKGQPSAWQVCFDLKQADDAEVLAKTEIRFMSWTTPAAPSQEPALTGCNCRWGGDTQVQWCELHLAHKDAIHEWAERAKTAEAKLAQLSTSQEPVTLTESERVRCLIKAGCIGTVKMTYDSGPCEITRTSINADRLIEAIIAALREKEQTK